MLLSMKSRVYKTIPGKSFICQDQDFISTWHSTAAFMNSTLRYFKLRNDPTCSNMKRFSTVLALSGAGLWNCELFGLHWFMPSGCKEQREKQVSHSEHGKIAPLTEINTIPSPTNHNIHLHAFLFVYLLFLFHQVVSSLYKSSHSSFKSRLLAGN